MTQEETFFLPFWLWASVIAVVNMNKLRYAEVTDRYKDRTTGKSKTIFVLPEMYTNKERLFSFRELNITKYMREQIVKSNPAYQIENEPSRWYLARWIFLSLLPFLIFSFILIR